MKMEMVNEAVVATAQCEADAIALIKLASSLKVPAVTKVIGPGRGNYTRRKRYQRYASDHERLLAKRASQRKYYNKIKALAGINGTPVPINKIGS